MLDVLIEKVIPVFAMVALACALLLAGIGFFKGRGPTFELVRDEWECVEYRSSTNLYPQMAGEGIVLIPQTSRVCVMWKMKGSK